MWLYVPNLSTSSPSAPAEAGSISESSWQFQALEQSAWSRGKHSRQRNWYQRCKRDISLQRLFGAMPEPSTADAGVVAWTALLAASRASRIALPESDSSAKTRATSGRRPAASSYNLARGSSSSRTSAACSPAAAQSGFGETFTDWALRVREDCSRRRKSARAMRENASSSSQWPTMRSGDGALYQLRENVTDDRSRLEDVVANWPTPTTRDYKDTGNMENVPENGLLGRVAANWTTPSAGDGQRGGKITEAMSGTSLAQQVNSLWSTPRASDGEKGGPNQAFGAGGMPLPAQAHQWATPRAIEGEKGGQWQNANREGTKQTLTLTGQAQAIYSPLARVTVKTGKPHSKERRSLNPLFVEWLMGWPPGWTLLAWTDLGCSATALCLWRQRMRSALSQLASPAEAPPAQLALFG